ncbi:heptosyltransferase [Ulvibacter litoralis]|nr:heptosyltransferase [Ulvibacter litoralis]
MTIPVLRVVAQTYPEVKLTVVSRAFFKPLFDGIPNLTFLEADVYGKHKGLGLLKLSKEAKKIGVDAVADLHNVIRSKILTKALSFKGIPTSTIDKGRTEKKALTRAENKLFHPLKTTHQRYADVFTALGLPIALDTHVFPQQKRLIPKLNALIGVEPKKLIGIAPFAAFESKMYPLEQMHEVIAKLNTLNKYRIFLFGGGKKEVATLKALAKPFENVSSVAGTLSFEEELALLSNLDAMLAMDSGNGHLAAMFGVPTITLWGVTHPYAGFVPFNQPMEHQLCANREQFPLVPTSIYGNKFPEGYEKAIASISTEAIVTKLLAVV